MKQTLLLFLLSFITLSLSAQITFGPESVVEEFNPELIFDLKKDFDVSNITDTDQQFIWNVETVEAPPEWKFYICDLNLCYAPGTTFVEADAANTIQVDSTKTMNFHVLASGTEGYGKYIWNLTAVNDPSNVIASVELELTATLTVDISEEDIENITIFPNPVSDYFNIKNPNGAATQIVLYDVLGKQVRTYDAHGVSNFYMGDVQSGRYFARIFDESGKSLKVVRIVKR